MSHKWQKVYATAMAHRAGMVQQILEDRQYNPVLINKKDMAYHIGDFEIYVAPKYVLKAIKLLSDEVRFE